MVNEEVNHQRIERPSGLPGYRPALWCAVCGRRAELNKDISCTGSGCPNLCHRKCLDGETEYNCGNTAQLRERADISDHVIFLSQELTPPDLPNTFNLPDPTEREKLDSLTHNELVESVISLRAELASAKEQIKTYSEIIDELPVKRRIIVEALSVVDTLIALKDSGIGKERRSIASTARPEKIDKDWKDHIRANVPASECWDSQCDRGVS